MEAGVDPHLYRASEGDLTTMLDADVILYNGLNLEGQLADVLVQLAQDRPVVSLGAAIPEERRLNVPNFESEYDPHFWFDPTLWAIAAQATADAFAEADPDHATAYRENAAAYITELEALDAETMTALSAIPADQRVLVTAHDAFGYFGNRYGIEVIGIQGLSTETEAGVADLQRVADTIIQRNVPALFVESTISPASIEAVQEAVADRGGNVVIGGQLYSDAMGDAGTPEGTYLGMFRSNVATIVAAYTGTPLATPAT
jgi:manganese/zinc/iron transport system substrate-binding protein